MLRIRLPLVVLVLLALVSSAACSRGGDEAAVLLDGSPRLPDAEGVLDDVSHSHVTLDGRRYRVSPELQAFSTYTLEAIPIAGRRNQYVQVGLDGDEVVWLAAFGAVVRASGAEPTVYYTGVFRRLDAEAERAVFRDGSSVRLGPGVPVPKAGTRVRVEIDPVRHRARRVVEI